jgi:hemoglobin/transferrin/lactoferrin receptor protein
MLALAGSSYAAWAADAPAASLADTTQPAVFLRQTVVTGARYPRAYFESPQALSFLTRAQLRERMPNVLGDALYDLPGTDMSKDSPWEQRPVLRGLGGQRVLVLMDGDPVNSARGNGPHPSLVDPSQVERVEVVRGPSSVAYGSDALGGVINIITRQAPDAVTGMSLRGAATLGGSTVDRQSNASLQLMPQIGRFSAFISSGGRRTEDFETPDHGRVPGSSFSDYNGIANFKFALTDRTALKAGWQLYRGHEIGLPGLAFSFPGFEQAFHFPYYRRDAVHLAAEHDNAAASWLANSSVKAYWQNEGRDFYSHMAFDNSFFGPSAPPGTFVDNTDRYLKLNTVGVQAQVSSRRFARYRMTAGVDVARDMTNGTNVDKSIDNDPSGTPYGPQSITESRSLPRGDFDSYAGFTQTEWYLDPRWTLNLGGRYTHYHYRTQFGIAQPATSGGGGPPQPEVDFEPMKVDNDALAGSAGIVFAPRPDLHLTANVANGYRQPNAQDLFFNGPASVGIVLGNANLKPEKSVSSDLGLRWGPGTLAFSGNMFYSTYTDLIDAIQVAAGGGGAPATYQYVNITRARIWGGEAEGEWRFLPQWRVRAAVTDAIGDITSRDAILKLYGKDADQVPLSSVPPFKGSAALRWTSDSGRFWFEPSTRYSWRTNRLSPDPLFSQFRKEWIVGDVFAGARFGSGQRINVGVRNFTNRAYVLPLGSLEEPGISLVGSLTTEF